MRARKGRRARRPRRRRSRPADVTVAEQSPAAAGGPLRRLRVDGAPPVTVTCARASGRGISAGRDDRELHRRRRTGAPGTCSFSVTLTAVTLAVMTFDTIGDSSDRRRERPAGVDLPNAYPTKLQALFDATYPDQGIKVVNRGVSGGRSNSTVAELPGRLSSKDRPGGRFAERLQQPELQASAANGSGRRQRPARRRSRRWRSASATASAGRRTSTSATSSSAP